MAFDCLRSCDVLLVHVVNILWQTWVHSLAYALIFTEHNFYLLSVFDMLFDIFVCTTQVIFLVIFSKSSAPSLTVQRCTFCDGKMNFCFLSTLCTFHVLTLHVDMSLHYVICISVIIICAVYVLWTGVVVDFRLTNLMCVI